MSGTEPLFQQDAYLRSCTARVTEVLPDGVVLDRTVFYPLGGGQPGDTGVLRARDGREWNVIDTRKGEAGRILHRLDSSDGMPSPGDEVEAVLDWDRRYMASSKNAKLPGPWRRAPLSAMPEWRSSASSSALSFG